MGWGLLGITIGALVGGGWAPRRKRWATTAVAFAFGTLLLAATSLLVPGANTHDAAVLTFPTLLLAVQMWASDKKETRVLADLEQQIHDYIDESSKAFDPGDEDRRIWVVKYIAPRWLEAFMKTTQIGVASTPGFTWGDGVYVTPLQHAYSSMMYGRAGVLGYIERADTPRIYDATDPRGIQYYQDWIQQLTNLYNQLTTTVHADVANRELRNLFRQHFTIDLVMFDPDERTRRYSSYDARWYCVSDWIAIAAAAPKSMPLSTRVKECRWVSIVGEEFAREQYQVDWPRFFSPACPWGLLSSQWTDVTHPDDLEKHYKAAYSANNSAARPHPVNSLVHVRPMP